MDGAVQRRRRPIELASLLIVRSWFDRCTGRAPHPDDDVCFQLARGLQIAVNRQHNDQLEAQAGRELPVLDLADVSLAEIVGRRWECLRRAANHLAFEMERLEEYVPRHEWCDYSAALHDIDAALSAFGVLAMHLPAPNSKGRGHPGALWHSVGHFIAPLIQEALRNAGYAGRISKKDSESATAAIGAAAISWAYDMEIGADGFASAMRTRNRKKPKRP